MHDYQLRPSAAAVILRNFDDTVSGHGTQIETDVLQATVRLSTDRCLPGQELAVGLRINLKPGWYIYGPSVPKNYQALELTFDSPIVGEYSLALPSPTPLLLKAFGETLPVYTGNIQALGTLRIKWSPPMPVPFMEALGARIEPGSYTINGRLRFQACSEEVCESPQAIAFILPMRVEAGVPPAPKPTA
jgi:hypothetical protein